MDNNYDAKLILSSVFSVEIEDIPNNASLNNYNRWDSLSHVRIILHLEEVLDRSMSTEEILKATSIHNIQKILLGMD